MFNKYSVYGYQASNIQVDGDYKIFQDLRYLDTLTEYEDVCKFVNQVFGDVGKGKKFTYDDNLEVTVKPSENKMEVFAAQGSKIIVGKSWEFIPENKEQK